MLVAESSLEVRSRRQLRVQQYLPHWQWLGLAAVALLAGCLDLLRLGQEGYANAYYAAAVRSMLQSWHNFFFVSFDPGGFVSIDKPPLGFWIQTASAKLFGFHGWSLLLPQALAGVLSVALLFVLVRRVFGPVAGLLAALALAVTPISVATNRNNTIDSLLVLTVLLATWTVMKAAESGRLRWLLLGMALVGLGFNIKALEAFLVLPALVLVYFLAAPVGWRKRILHLVAAGAVLAVVSLSWVTVIDLTPASQRPYVGSSQHNSELELALGYNGLQRLLGGGMPGASRASQATQPSTQTQSGDNAGQTVTEPRSGSSASGGGPGGVGENGPVGPFRLLDAQLGGQIGWLIPAAVLGLVAAWQIGVRRRPDPRHQSLIVWGVWLLTCAAFFSKALFFHRYYLSMLAPAIAALFGIGAVALWQAYRRGGLRGWLLPLTLLATAAIQAYILRSYAGWNGWLTPIVVATCALATLVLTFARSRRRLRLPAPALAGAAGLGFLALLAAPAVWAGDTVRNNAAAGAVFAAGPSTGAIGRFGGPEGAPPFAQTARSEDDGPALPQPGDGAQGASSRQLEQYLLANQGSATYLVAVPSSMAADQLILDTSKPVMAMGGFSGGDPILTAQSFAALVKQGQVRFVELGGMGGSQQDVSTWVQTSCTVVPASQLQDSSAGSATVGSGGGQQLYDCAAASGSS